MDTKRLEKAFCDEMRQVVELLQIDEQKARQLFNSKLYPQYANAVADAASPLRLFFFFFQELDEYLNNSGARTLGQATKEKLMWSYADFQAEAAEALGNEKRGLLS